ncbi:MAG TPA: PaaI family thioesterase [Caulobacteraceae bacterium]|jgi:uncharacterized protein (TIGR00369 family)
MRRVEVTEGEFAGWTKFTNEAFEGVVGPFHFRMEDGRPRCAFRAEPRHLNAGGRMHGGCLMTFADFALFMVSMDALEGDRGVTVTLDNTFVDAGWPGELIEARGEVTRAGASLIFARGEVFTGERTLLTFSGVIKRLKRRT